MQVRLLVIPARPDRRRGRCGGCRRVRLRGVAGSGRHDAHEGRGRIGRPHRHDDHRRRVGDLSRYLRHVLEPGADHLLPGRVPGQRRPRRGGLPDRLGQAADLAPGRHPGARPPGHRRPALRQRPAADPGPCPQHLRRPHGRQPAAVAGERRAARRGQTLDQLAADHQSWWHAFYPKSFLTVPETRLQSFYWIQLYKMASATRRDRPVVATHGPWLEKTPWPGVWWNLNVQLEYWLINATGHTELDSLSASLDRYRDNLATNVPSGQRSDSYGMARTSQEDLLTGTVATPGSGGEVGDLTWAIHNAWLTYRHTMDDTVLSGAVFPLLRKAINYYLHFLAKDSSGTYHLPSTFSPEYAAAPDCNYDLALIHWGCATLLASAKRLGITDPLASKWQDVLDHLTKPPQDGTDGVFIGAGVKLTPGHRHYSHPFGVDPPN